MVARLPRRAILTASLGLAVASALPPRLAHAAPKADLWPVWEAHDAASSAEIDHSQWSAFLDAWHVLGDVGIARIRYAAAIKGDGADLLDDYISHIVTTKISTFNRDQQFCFWVNLYNALTVQLVLKNWPVKSIRDIGGGLFSPGPWRDKLVEIEGRSLSLDDIEHRILRPIWQDNRIHYAVNCASIGCPNLAGKAYTAPALEQMLDDAASSFINHKRGVDHLGGGRYACSSLFHWYMDDFGGDANGLFNHWRKHATGDLARAFRLRVRPRLASHDYDWSLNAAA